MKTSDPTGNSLREMAQTLIGAPITEFEPIRGGRNSRLYRIRSRDSTFALKLYPTQQDNLHDRLTTEVDALRLMKRHQFGAVPGVVAVDRDHGFVLLSWIEGEPLTTVSASDIDQAVAFLAAIYTLQQTPTFGKHRHAAEACLAAIEIEQQISARLKRLKELPAEEESLHAFLENSFGPAFDRLVGKIRVRMRTVGLDYSAALPQEKRCLVPSDFGFHNSLRRSDGSLAFFDFEYFGWDDPVKLTADVLLHPGMQMSPAQRQRFRCAAEHLYGVDATFRARLDALYPLFALRWALIVLNEFLPDRWRHRVTTGAAERWTVAKQRQLALAHGYVANVAAEKHQ